MPSLRIFLSVALLLSLAAAPLPAQTTTDDEEAKSLTEWIEIAPPSVNKKPAKQTSSRRRIPAFNDLHAPPEIIGPAPPAERLPPGGPRLPPESIAPGDRQVAPQDGEEPLPPLEEELFNHGGSYLYAPEGDHLGWPAEGEDTHYEVLRLPEDWRKPRPVELFSQFLGNDPIQPDPLFHWIGPGGYVWEPRFVGYGSYQLFGFGIDQNNQTQAALGHQMILDLDFRLTGTERFHVQFRPFGKRNTGGSYYQFTDPTGYVNNGTGEPQRYWFEGELASMLGAFVDPFAVRDYHITAGKFPFALHNFLLINDEILGVALNKNTIYVGDLSNINLQMFYAFNDVDAFAGNRGQLYGVNAFIDYRRVFYEASYVFAQDVTNPTRDTHYAALSRTQLLGPLTTAARALVKIGDAGGIGSGQLFVLESNRNRVFDRKPLGVEHGVFYTNAFLATKGWSSLGGSNFNRLWASFAVNPLVQIAAGFPTNDTWGVSSGVQLFRRHENESLIPEVAFQAPGNTPVWGLGLTYQRKTTRRTYFEALGVVNFSDNPLYRRAGAFLTETILF